MKKTITILALSLIGTLAFAQQAPAIQWQKAYGGVVTDQAYTTQPTPDGGYIVAGSTSSTDGDVTGNHGWNDAWVMKLSATGAMEWQKALGGTADEYAYSIQLTSDGGYILAGTSQSNDGNVTGNHGNNDFWVVKLAATGTILWQKSLGGVGLDVANSIQSTSDGGYIVAGYTDSSDGNVTGNHGNGDAWVVKLSSTGTLLWQKTLGGTGTDSAQSIQPTTDGGYILAGVSYSNDGDVTGNHGDTDAWIVKLGATGTIVWQKSLGGIGSDIAYSIQSTTDGGYVMAGYTRSNDGDVTGNHGNYDFWVVKLGATGTIQWQKTIGGSGDDGAYSIQSTTDGGYVVAGYTASANGDVTGNHGSYDCWVVKLSTIGTLLWQKALGGTGDDRTNCIQTTSDGGCILAGYAKSNDGDVIGGHGSDDVWVVKLGPDLATTGFEKSTVVVYPNPASAMLTIQNTSNIIIESITITDVMGKVVLSQTTNTNQVNVASLASGIYLLEATSGKDKFTSKFVKE